MKKEKALILSLDLGLDLDQSEQRDAQVGSENKNKGFLQRLTILPSNAIQASGGLCFFAWLITGQNSLYIEFLKI